MKILIVVTHDLMCDPLRDALKRRAVAAPHGHESETHDDGEIAFVEVEPRDLAGLLRVAHDSGGRGFSVNGTTGSEVLTRLVAGLTVPECGAPGARDLSPREREVLQGLADGKTSKEIARDLHVALATVETHRRQVSNKLGIRSIAALTKFAIRAGLTSLEP